MLEPDEFVESSGVRSSIDAGKVLGISAAAALKRWQRLRERLRETLPIDTVIDA